MMRTTSILLLLAALFLSSCFKEDERVPAHPRGDVITDTVAMSSTYKYQVWYNLQEDSAVASGLKSLADLGFECSPQGWKIVLNTACFMTAADLGEATFGVAQDTAGLKWHFDKSDGNPDSLAIGRWFSLTGDDTLSLNHIYLINSGVDEDGNPRGVRQVIVDSLSKGSFYFRYAKLDGSNPVSASVAKDSLYNFRWFSFATNGIVAGIEPLKNSYDLFFTQYTTLLFTDLGEAYPYLVTGVLLNPYSAQAVLDTLHTFESIDLDLARSMNYTSALDAIGYDWKYYGFTTGGYTIRLNYNYVIRCSNGVYYKLRFVSFYNALGEKGNPVFEFQEL